MHRWIIGLAASLLGTFIPISSGQTATIYVESTADDMVGKRLTYSLREVINRSSIHKLATYRNDAGFIIALVTLDPDDKDKRTVYSAVLLMPELLTPPEKRGYDGFITSVVGACGVDVTESCASNIISRFDENITQIVEIMTEVMRKVPTN